MPALKFENVRAEYADLWRSMRIDPARVPAFQATAKRLLKGMDRYKAVSRATGVPAAMIAILHERESGADFSTYLGNGEPLNRVTRIVPIGRGPFRNFEEGAIDALAIDGLSKIKDWTLETMLYKAEAFNGFGYRGKGIRSPYLWGGTNHQQRGKYVRDGVFDATVMDTQLGAAGVLFSLMMADTDLAIKLATPETASSSPTRPPAPPQAPTAPKPAPTVNPPPVTGPDPKTAVAGIGSLLVGVFAWLSSNPWVLIVGIAFLAAGFVAYQLLKKD